MILEIINVNAFVSDLTKGTGHDDAAPHNTEPTSKTTINSNATSSLPLVSDRPDP
jgi:hypothetical protein